MKTSQPTTDSDSVFFTLGSVNNYPQLRSANHCGTSSFTKLPTQLADIGRARSSPRRRRQAKAMGRVVSISSGLWVRVVSLYISFYPPIGFLISRQRAECFMYGSHSVAAVHSRLIGIKGELCKNVGWVGESLQNDDEFRLGIIWVFPKIGYPKIYGL